MCQRKLCVQFRPHHQPGQVGPYQSRVAAHGMVPNPFQLWGSIGTQVKRFKPKLVAVRNESLVNELKKAIADCEEKPEIIPGEQGVVETSRCCDGSNIGCAGLKVCIRCIFRLSGIHDRV